MGVGNGYGKHYGYSESAITHLNGVNGGMELLGGLWTEPCGLQVARGWVRVRVIEIRVRVKVGFRG